MKRIAIIAAGCLAACGDLAPPVQEGDTGLAVTRAPDMLPAEEAVRRADPARLDPATMDEAEIARGLNGPGYACAFSYADAGGIILAIRAQEDPSGRPVGVMKLNNHLVILHAVKSGGAETIAGGIRLAVGDVVADVALVPGSEERTGTSGRQWQADLRFKAGDALDAGYRGFYRCGG